MAHVEASSRSAVRHGTLTSKRRPDRPSRSPWRRLALAIVACSGGPATPAPTSGGDAPSVSTSTPPGTDAPSSGDPSGSLSGDFTLWHTYSSGAGTELDALNQVLDQVRTANPELNLEVVEQPFDGVFDRYGLEVAGSGGPDLFIAPNDSLGQLSRDGTILGLHDYIGDGLSGTLDLAVEGSQVDGTLYQVPESLKAVALYYNAETVTTPPATTDELLTGVENGDYTVGCSAAPAACITTSVGGAPSAAS